MSDGYIQKGPLLQSGRSEPPRPHSGTEPNNPKQQQLQLLAATGGAEGACYKCLAPFGVALLVSGAAVSAVAYGRNAHGSPITLLGLALLGLGALLGLLGAAGCLLHRHHELSRARRESRTTLVAAAVP
ncbi:transmembrane protein 100 [Lampetra planeri]